MKKMRVVFWISFVSCIFGLATGLIGCSDEESSRRTLQQAGYKNIRITGWEMWGCGEDDTYTTGFTAQNPAGQTVSGVVCCGSWGKGCTIRF